MRILFLTAVRRIRRSLPKTLTVALSLLFSSLLISAFCQASLNIGKYFGSSSSSQGEVSVKQFLETILSRMSSVLVVVAIISILSIIVYINMRSDENKAFLSALESVGALRRQGRAILLLEAILSYVFPLAIGAIIGSFVGGWLSGSLIASVIADFRAQTVFLTAVTVFAVGTVLVVTLTLITTLGRAPLIERLKGHNREEADARHSYRNSYTFKNMPLEKRIAKKSVEYYKASSGRISLMLAATAMYPVIGAVFFYTMSGLRVIVDEDPFDGIDTAASATAAIESIMLFTLFALVALSVIGIIQITVMLKARATLRRKSMKVYKSVGMSELSVKKVLKYERGAMIFSALIYTVFAAIIVAVIFGS